MDPMNTNMHFSSNEVIDLSRRDVSFSDQVKRRSGVNIDLCWQCRTAPGTFTMSPVPVGTGRYRPVQD